MLDLGLLQHSEPFNHQVLCESVQFGEAPALVLCSEALRAVWCAPEADGRARTAMEISSSPPSLTQSRLLPFSLIETLNRKYLGKERSAKKIENLRDELWEMLGGDGWKNSLGSDLKG